MPEVVFSSRWARISSSFPDCTDLEEDGFGREPWFQCFVVEDTSREIAGR